MVESLIRSIVSSTNNLHPFTLISYDRRVTCSRVKLKFQRNKLHEMMRNRMYGMSRVYKGTISHTRACFTRRRNMLFRA